jgi:hypothetical protein
MGDGESFGGSTTDSNEQALTAVANFIQAVQPGSMSAFTAPGQKRWDTLGLLAYGTVLESNVLLEPEDNGDQDD